jgi:hypothetical protein
MPHRCSSEEFNAPPPVYAAVGYSHRDFQKRIFRRGRAALDVIIAIAMQKIMSALNSFFISVSFEFLKIVSACMMDIRASSVPVPAGWG